MDETNPEVDGDLIATIGQRVAARLIDWFLLLAIWVVVGGSSSEQIGDAAPDIPRWAVLAWIGLVIFYEAGMVAARGQTIGKLFVGIELVNLRDGSTPAVGPALIRVMPVAVLMAVLGTFFPIVLVFVYFSAAFMANSRGVLDLIAGTVVIQARNGRGVLRSAGLG